MKNKPLKFGNVWKIKPVKTFDFKFNLDTDKDGVKDWKDCRPFNHWYQDVEDWTKEIPVKPTTSHFNQDADSDAKYQRMLEEPIEKGIQPLVNYLNSIGFKTAFSCQGHPTEEAGAYVSIKRSEKNGSRLFKWAQKEGFVLFDTGSKSNPYPGLAKQYSNLYHIAIYYYDDYIDIRMYPSFRDISNEQWVMLIKKIVKRLINSMKRYNA